MSDKDEKEIPPVLQRARMALLHVWARAGRGAHKPSWMTEGQWTAAQSLNTALEKATALSTDDVEALHDRLVGLDSDGRREFFAFLQTLESLCHASLSLAVRVATEKEDNWVVPCEQAGHHIWLGEGPAPAPEHHDHEAASGGLPPALIDILKKKIAEASGWDEKDVQIEAMGTIELGGSGISRLQDEYVDDPIAQIARKLDRMPGGKRPKLPPKKIPEC